MCVCVLFWFLGFFLVGLLFGGADVVWLFGGADVVWLFSEVMA